MLTRAVCLPFPLVVRLRHLRHFENDRVSSGHVVAMFYLVKFISTVIYDPEACNLHWVHVLKIQYLRIPVQCT